MESAAPAAAIAGGSLAQTRPARPANAGDGAEKAEYEAVMETGTVVELPLVPLPDAVAFPKLSLPLVVNRPGSLWAIDEAEGTEGLVLLVTQRAKRRRKLEAAELYEVGTVARVARKYKVPEGGLNVLFQGVHRARVFDVQRKGAGLVAAAVQIKPKSESSVRIEALRRLVASQVQEFGEKGSGLSAEVVSMAKRIPDPGWLADLVAASAPMPVRRRQSLLETFDPYERLYQAGLYLSEQIHILDVRGHIQSEIQEGVEKVQREFYLREQLKAIQRELGMSTGQAEDLEGLRSSVRASSMPAGVTEKTLKEIDRLEATPPASPEIGVIRTYVDWLLDLPWGEVKGDAVSLSRARAVLDEDHYGLRKVKERVLEYLAVRGLSSSLRSPILCLAGPPGVGKTSLGRSIARALKRKFVRVSLGGVRDEAEIRGHRRTYVGALPGRIIQGMKLAGAVNPVFVLDEVDKIGRDFRGDPSSALLEVLDPQHNSSFSDHYLEVGYDLSKVLFVLTANDAGSIPPTLRDRLEVIQLSGYTEEEKLRIALGYLLPRQLREHGLKPDQMSLSEGALRGIVRNYTREAGVRELERQIAAVCRKAARAIAQVGARFRVNASRLESLLGNSKFVPDEEKPEDAVGSVNGLAVTPFGGEVLSVEAAWMEGKAGFTCTGNLRDVMEESAKAALAYTRSKAKEFGIQPHRFESSKIHLHVPAGAVPKDGPSAGIAMGTALVSALTGARVRGDVAMTGEITIKGKILPIGGVKDKVLAAHRLGIRLVVLPEGNRADIEEVPKQVRKSMKFIWVEHMDQVLAAALRPEELLGLGMSGGHGTAS